MTRSKSLRLTNIGLFPNGEMGIVWNDGHESYYSGHRLRCACPCASCVEEMTGAKTLQDSQVPSSVRVAEFHPVGNYGVSVRWSDGHDTGIYTFTHLRTLCECEKCSGQ